MMKSNLFALLVATSFVATAVIGCFPEQEGATDDQEYRLAIPAAGLTDISVPDNAGSGALALGERAEFYEFTRGVSGSVNAHVGTLLLYLRLYTLLPPSERGDDYRVWGPTEPEDLEAVSWRLTVRKLTDERFEVTLDGRPKGTTNESDFLPTVFGEVTPGDLEGGGFGTLTLDYDNAAAIGADPCRGGQIEISWDAQTTVRDVDVAWRGFENTCDANEEFIDVTYHYEDDTEAGGAFEFVVIEDLHFLDSTKPADETVRVRSRWAQNGVGRSDVIVSSSEIEADLAAAGVAATEVQASQCWDENFNLVFSDTAPDELEAFIQEQLGVESDCGMSTAEYPSL